MAIANKERNILMALIAAGHKQDLGLLIPAQVVNPRNVLNSMFMTGDTRLFYRGIRTDLCQYDSAIVFGLYPEEITEEVAEEMRWVSEAKYAVLYCEENGGSFLLLRPMVNSRGVIYFQTTNIKMFLAERTLQFVE